MSIRKSVLLGGVLVLLGSVLVAPQAVAAPTGPAATVARPQTKPPAPTVVSDVFPGAQIGKRATFDQLAASSVTPSADAGASSVVCDGDGVSGERVEVFYLREATMPDRYNQLLPVIRAWLANADDNFNDAAAAHGYSRHIRFVTEPSGGSCRPVVHSLLAPAGSLATFEGGIGVIEAAGFNELNDRKYLMLTEATVICGVGTMWSNDPSPGPGNLNNSWTTHARVDASLGCLGAGAIAHELAHTFGAVQDSAPFASGAHCTDQADLMCAGQNFSCVEWTARRLPDCNSDNYFHPNPPAGNWLASNWNIANSDFFIKGNSVDPINHARAGYTYAITSASTGEAIEVVNGSTAQAARLSQRTRTDVPAQRWVGHYEFGLQFLNANSQLCMDIVNDASGSETSQSTCDHTEPKPGGLPGERQSTSRMQWAYLPHGDGTYGILNWKTGLALTIGGTYPAPLSQQVYTGAANQRWRFNQISVPAPQHNAVYNLSSFENRDNVDVAGGSMSSGTLITHSAPTTAASQRWRLLATGSYWRLQNVNSNHCLDLVSASTSAGVQLRQATCSSTATRQQWTLRRVADGVFLLVNRYSNLVLNMPVGTGTVLDQQAVNPEERERVWFLKPV